MAGTLGRALWKRDALRTSSIFLQQRHAYQL
jgi:hypothetical protein